MTAPREQPRPDIATDLVEYIVLTIPEPQALSEVVAGLVRLVESAAIRILDLILVSVDERGVAEVVNPETLSGFDAPDGLIEWADVVLSRHDIELVALALQPGDLPVIVVAEDRWAEPLAAAARALGGEVRAGERIARERVQAALDRTSEPPEEG